MKEKLLICILVFSLLFQLVYAVPSDEVMDCVVNRIMEDCKGMKILKCTGVECSGLLENDTEIQEYLTNWIQEWEKQGVLLQYSYTPLVCTSDLETQAHSFRVDSTYNPIWDGKKISCPSEITNITNNWTVFGLTLVSNGGLTIIGITIFGIGGITFIGFGILITIFIVIKKKRVSVKEYTIIVQKKSKR